jgi:aryl-alcohol dehydrogenase-like predicted oxidoreductase
MALKHGLGLLPWGSLAAGMLAGRYLDAANPPPDSRAVLRGGIYAERVTPRAVAAGMRFSEMARTAGISPAQLGLLWVKEQPGVTAPLYGPRTVEQLTAALPILEMQLSDELRHACDAINPPGSAVANFHNTAPWMKQRIDP